MSQQTMASELSAQIPGLEYIFGLTLVNRAWLDVQRSFLWSFLYGTWPIPTPKPISTGTATVTLGSNLVVGNAAAVAAWNAIPLSTPITTQQFRVGQGTIYDIIAYNSVTGTLTLNQAYVDPPNPGGIGYTIMGNYYNAPVQDFLWFESIVDPVSGYKLKTTLTREYVDEQDPQRFQSGWPVGFIPYGINQYAGSYFNFPRCEAWPAPVSNYTYVGTYFRSGSAFPTISSTVPPQLGEDVVMARAKYYGYEWAIANMNRSAKVNKNGGFTYLMSQAEKQYNGLLDTYILKDESFSHRHLIDAPESTYLANLPWVSMRESIGFFPN